jgi:hypothetical protein
MDVLWLIIGVIIGLVMWKCGIYMFIIEAVGNNKHANQFHSLHQ